MPGRIALVWEKNGPNLHTTIAERDIFIGRNDTTGRWHVAVDNQFVHMSVSKRAAKAAAERIAYEIYEEVS